VGSDIHLNVPAANVMVVSNFFAEPKSVFAKSEMRYYFNKDVWSVGGGKK